VQLDPALEATLRAQLPMDTKYDRLCWYQLPSGNLEAQKSEYGYEYEYRAGRWVFVRKNYDPVIEE
jgi:hypothetical protein